MLLMLAPLTLKRVSAWVSEPLFDRFWISKVRTGKKSEWDSRSEDWRMLMHTQRPHCVARGRNLPNGVLLPNVPQLHLSIPRPTYQLSEPTTLHMHVGDPLLVLSPTSDHG